VTVAAILVTGLGVVLLLPLIWRALGHRFDPFEPIVLFVLAYGSVFVARPAAMLVHGDFQYGGVDLSATFPLLTFLAFVGGVAFLIAYEVSIGAALARVVPRPRPVALRGGVTGSLLLILLAGIASTAIVLDAGGIEALRLYAQGRSGASGSVLTGLGSYVWFASRLIVPAAFCLIALAMHYRSRPIALAAGAASAAALLVTVPMGSRLFLLPLFGGVFVFAYVRRRARPSARFLAALIVVALFASYAAVILREPERRSNAGSEFAELGQRPYRVFDLILYRGDAEMAPVLAGALTVVPERLGYRYGAATLGEFVIRPVPRQLWHGKPQVPGEQVVEAVWPHLAGYFHPAFSPLLSFYWDFGIAGILGGMALAGVGCRLLYAWFCRHAESFGAQLIFSVALWYVVVGVRNQPAETAGFALFFLVPLILIERFSAFPRSILRPFRAHARLSQR
jgi:hypothetical protein